MPWCGYDGTVTYQPEWDCTKCDNCNDMEIIVTKEEPAYYPNKNCCPVPKNGEYIQTIRCPDAKFVVPISWDSSDPNLVTVEAEPDTCTEQNRVKFIITTKPGTPPATATVTCTAAFFSEYGETNAETITIAVKPGCGKCCNPTTPCPPGIWSLP